MGSVVRPFSMTMPMTITSTGPDPSFHRWVLFSFWDENKTRGGGGSADSSEEQHTRPPREGRIAIRGTVSGPFAREMYVSFQFQQEATCPDVTCPDDDD